MKKIFYLAAAMSIALFASCNKEGDQAGTEDKGPQVTVATDALVLHLAFEDETVPVGEGVTFAEKKGNADFAEGFIGKCYTNKAADKSEAYLKYNLAAQNCIKNLKSFTFAAWVKRSENGSGTFFSVNGGEHDWGSTMQFFFDNCNTNEETGIAEQQFNARIDSYKENEEGVKYQASCWPNVAGAEFATLDKWYHVARTYDAATGAWKVYVDGVKFATEGVHEIGDPAAPFGDLDLAAEGMDALYIGGWAAIIDGVNNQDWMTFYNGSLDEVRLYNRALTDEEIGKLWQEEKLINLE